MRYLQPLGLSKKPQTKWTSLDTVQRLGVSLTTPQQDCYWKIPFTAPPTKVHTIISWSTMAVCAGIFQTLTVSTVSPPTTRPIRRNSRMRTAPLFHRNLCSWCQQSRFPNGLSRSADTRALYQVSNGLTRRICWTILPKNTTARTVRPTPCLQDWSTVRIVENAFGLSPNPTAGQTASRDSSMFVPATVQENVPFVRWTAFCLMNLWSSSYPTLPMRTANTLKKYSIRKRPIFSAHRRMKKSCPTSERKKHNLKRQ